MAKVVYVDWRDRMYEPEIIGVYECDSEGYTARENKEYELKDEGYDTEEEVRVWIEEIGIVRDEKITNEDIKLIMSALCGTPIVTSAQLADKVERILKRYLV